MEHIIRTRPARTQSTHDATNAVSGDGADGAGVGAGASASAAGDPLPSVQYVAPSKLIALLPFIGQIRTLEMMPQHERDRIIQRLLS